MVLLSRNARRYRNLLNLKQFSAPVIPNFFSSISSTSTPHKPFLWAASDALLQKFLGSTEVIERVHLSLHRDTHSCCVHYMSAYVSLQILNIFRWPKRTRTEMERAARLQMNE